MVKDGIPYVIIPAIGGLLAGFFQLWPVFFALAAVSAFMAFFFRDPERVTPEGDDLIISAADGRVTRIEKTAEGKVVSVFLSPLDVHINRSPITGRVARIEYTPGKKLPATGDNASYLNERNSIYIEGANMNVVCTQIAGILARRIVCRANPGDQLLAGERFGLIKFGSRTDLLMPDSVEIMVNIGDRVIGGETVIARLPQ